MIPICLITGFLGAGKTTFLRRVMSRYKGRRMAYIVNEFSTTNVDGALLEGEGEEVETIVGGSILCRCRTTDFLTVLQSYVRPGEGPWDGMVIEASGIADPSAMGKLLAEARLDTAYRVSSIICLVDPGSFPKLLKTLPNIVAQVKSASTILINKADLYSDVELQELTRSVREINPHAPIVRTSFCQGDFELFSENDASLQEGEFALCRDPNFETCKFHFSQPINLEDLKKQLSSCEEILYRAKGFVPTSEGIVYFDYSKSGYTSEKVESDQARSELVLIVRGGEAQAVRDALDSLI
jgi:G3E family GTPase